MIHLNRYHHFTELMRTKDIGWRLRPMTSSFDGTTQSLLEIYPAVEKPSCLIFFFHGMDGDAGDAVIVRQLITGMHAKVVALGGRGPCWLSDAFCSDSVQTIRENLGSHTHFYLMGVSMGGTQALTLAGSLPADLTAKVQGVVALLPGGDLPLIANESTHPKVRRTVLESVAGDVEKLKVRSPIAALEQYPEDLPLSLFYNEDDTVVPLQGLKEFIAKAKRAGHPLSEFHSSGNHDFTYTDFNFIELFDGLKKEIVKQLPPPTHNP